MLLHGAALPKSGDGLPAAAIIKPVYAPILTQRSWRRMCQNRREKMIVQKSKT